MASFSSATRELVLKIVYYGPGLGGKTTTLRSLHAAVRPEHRGKMISLATPVDRTLYFDFLPVRLPSVGDLQLRLQLFTVPGQVYFNATRKLVLTGADGIVFVADSQVARLDADIESIDNLRENLAELGRPIESVPIVLAYNKRDLGDILSIDELDEKLNPHGFPALAASATQSRGVFETLDAAVRVALDDLRRKGVIPAEVAVPADGLVAARLREVRTDRPQDVEPVRIVSGEAPRTLSGTMQAVVPPSAPTPTSTAATIPDTSVPDSVSAAIRSVALTTPAPVPPSAYAQPRVPTITPAAAVPPPTPVMSPPVGAAQIAAATAAASQPAAMPAPSPSAQSSTHQTAVVPPVRATESSSRLQAIAARGVGSLASLFDAEEHESLRNIEEAIAELIYARAVLLLEALMVRVLDRTARATGRDDAPPESIAWMLGLASERFFRLRTAAQRARRGGEVSRREALDAYLLVVSAQLAATDRSGNV